MKYLFIFLLCIGCAASFGCKKAKHVHNHYPEPLPTEEILDPLLTCNEEEGTVTVSNINPDNPLELRMVGVEPHDVLLITADETLELDLLPGTHIFHLAEPENGRVLATCILKVEEDLPLEDPPADPVL
jgi:hypothetical protein